MIIKQAILNVDTIGGIWHLMQTLFQHKLRTTPENTASRKAEVSLHG